MEAQAQANVAKGACTSSLGPESRAHATEAEARVTFAFAGLEAVRDALHGWLAPCGS